MTDLLITLLIIGTPITKITFDGNESIAGRVLMREIISKKGEEYNDVNINIDTERITRLYETEGFFNAEVTPKIASTKKGAKITFRIKEGKRPTIEKIIIRGGDKEEIKKLFEIKANDFFVRGRIRSTGDNITNYYKDHGYPYADVQSSICPDSGIVRFVIEKGTIHYIRNIEISGLKTCRSRVLYREMELKKGDTFSRSKLLKTQRNIYGLAFFSTVNVDILKNEPDSIDLIFSVKELKSRLMNFGIGLSVPLSFLISFGIEELNLFNQGHRFQIRPSFKINIEREWETKLEGRYIIPHLTSLDLTVGILPFFWFEEETDFTRQTRGNELRVSKLVSENILLTAANQYKYVDFEPKIILPDTVKGITNSIRLQLLIDYREEFFNPERGIYLLPVIEYAGGLFGGVNHFVRFEIEKKLFIPFRKTIIAQRLKFGIIIPTDGLAIYEKYYLGGQYSIRGYPERSIGPDSIGSDRYGDFLANYNFEYRIPLPFNFGVVGFFDVGYIDNDIDISHTDFLKASTGFGARYYTPIGPLRFDMGFPLMEQQMEQNYELYFGIYHIF